MFSKLAGMRMQAIFLLPMAATGAAGALESSGCRNQHSAAPTSQILRDTMNAFIVGGVVPDLLPSFDPIATMRVVYQPQTVFSTVFFPGQRVPQELTKNQPKIRVRLPPDQSSNTSTTTRSGPTLSSKSSYTFIMIDPDVPSRINTTLGPYRHMLATQVKLIAKPPYFELHFGVAPLTAYEAPTPPEGTSFHRYTFLLYPDQPAKEVLESFNHTYPSRFNFNLRKFVIDAGLCDPIAATFMFTENSKDESEDLIH